MTLFTTYLSALKKVHWNPCEVFPKSGRCVSLYYVMRNRGNNAVAPTKETLATYKEMQKQRISYAFQMAAKNYLDNLLDSEEAKVWIDKVAHEAIFNDVFLICYEKNPRLCHRTILAEQIVFRHPEVRFLGDLTDFENRPDEKVVMAEVHKDLPKTETKQNE